MKEQAHLTNRARSSVSNSLIRRTRRANSWGSCKTPKITPAITHPWDLTQRIRLMWRKSTLKKELTRSMVISWISPIIRMILDSKNKESKVSWKEGCRTCHLFWWLEVMAVMARIIWATPQVQGALTWISNPSSTRSRCLSSPKRSKCDSKPAWRSTSSRSTSTI